MNVHIYNIKKCAIKKNNYKIITHKIFHCYISLFDMINKRFLNIEITNK